MRCFCSFSSADTCPHSKARWPDALQLVDGHFSPGGLSILVSDVAGQFSLYGMGTPDPGLLRAPYDQFLNQDYSELIRDQAQNVLDLATQLPPHLLHDRQALCDFLMNPYDEGVQTGYKKGNMSAYVPVRSANAELPSGLVQWPPTVTAAQWFVRAKGGSETAVQVSWKTMRTRETTYTGLCMFMFKYQTHTLQPYNMQNTPLLTLPVALTVTVWYVTLCSLSSQPVCAGIHRNFPSHPCTPLCVYCRLLLMLP